MDNTMKIIKEKYLNRGNKFKDVQPGCDVKVFFKIKEQNKERILNFTGLVIARKGVSMSETITVRNVIDGIGVERIFPLNAPNIVNIEILKRGKVRRAKLYYIRERVGRATKLEEKLTKTSNDVVEKELQHNKPSETGEIKLNKNEQASVPENK